MTTRTLRSGQFDHRLETLEGRSLLSAAPIPDPSGAAQLTPTMVVADASFLNASSDPAPAAQPGATDADMYDFGGAWGTASGRAPQQAGAAVAHHVEIDSAFGDDFGPMRPGQTPADVLGRVHVTYAPPADYGTTTPIITQNIDPVPADAPTPEAPAAAVATAPATPAPAPVVAPIAAAPVAVPASPTAGIWLEVPVIGKAAGTTPAVEQVVIVSTFVKG